MENNKGPVYYLGRRQSDIVTTFDADETDTFFKGSITCYGDGKDGNISYNSHSGIQLSDDDSKYGSRNKAIYTKFFSAQCRNVIEKDPDAFFMPFSDYFAQMVPEEFKDRIICFNNLKAITWLSSKINFRKLVEKVIPVPSYKIMKGSKVLKLIESGEYPTKQQVAVQAEYTSGGEETFLLTRKYFEEEGYAKKIKSKIDSKQEYLVSEYIENIGSVGIQMQISNNEIALYPPSIQVMKGPVYIGSDLVAYTKLDEEVKEKCEEIAQEFGYILQNLDKLRIKRPGFKNAKIRGFIGIDVIVGKDGKVYAIETNPRFTGATGLLNILSHMAEQGSVYEHAYQAFYDKKTSLTRKFKKIEPLGRKKYADEDGKEGYEQEGLDETVHREEGCYTHAIFERVRKRKFNIFEKKKKK
ncbi:MAG: hypothetical protein FWD89_00220 [Firmicutes bacterium]|nr:hypothetical protein [Bacillota bacterium]MCL2770724.1 hypothetical protein [Bacillota bacterium]